MPFPAEEKDMRFWMALSTLLVLGDLAVLIGQDRKNLATIDEQADAAWAKGAATAQRGANRDRLVTPAPKPTPLGVTGNSRPWAKQARQRMQQARDGIAGAAGLVRANAAAVRERASVPLARAPASPARAIERQPFVPGAAATGPGSPPAAAVPAALSSDPENNATDGSTRYPVPTFEPKQSPFPEKPDTSTP